MNDLEKKYRRSGAHTQGQLDDLWRAFGELQELVADAFNGDDQEDQEPEEVDATDAARELAEAEGVELSEIDGSGEDGRILVGDVRELLDAE